MATIALLISLIFVGITQIITTRRLNNMSDDLIWAQGKVHWLALQHQEQQGKIAHLQQIISYNNAPDDSDEVEE